MIFWGYVCVSKKELLLASIAICHVKLLLHICAVDIFANETFKIDTEEV